MFLGLVADAIGRVFRMDNKDKYMAPKPHSASRRTEHATSHSSRASSALERHPEIPDDEIP